jgi:ATP-dependent Lon protease
MQRQQRPRSPPGLHRNPVAVIVTVKHPETAVPAKSRSTQAVPGLEQALLAAAADSRQAPVPIPERVPLVPLRNALLWPGAVAPLEVARVPARAAVQHALASNRLLALFARIDAAEDAPAECDLHRVGVLSWVSNSIDYGTGLYVVVRALAWVQLTSLEAGEPYSVGRLERFVVRDDGGEELAEVEQAVRARSQAFAASLPDAESALARSARMSALELADAAIAASDCEVAAKARYTRECSLLSRLKLMLILTEAAGRPS